MITRSELQTAKSALNYLLAGAAIVTLARGETRYTYRIRRVPDRPDAWFVSLLTGSLNTADYSYLGMIFGEEFKLTQKSRLPADSPPVAMISWALRNLAFGRMPEDLEVWHEGKCGRCGRTLTVPESIENGIGPECAKVVTNW